MISTVTYNGDGATRVFPVAFEIRGEDYVVVFINNIGVSDRTKYDIINNSIVFSEGEAPIAGEDNVKIVVATSPSEIADLNTPPSSIQTVLDNLTEIIDVATLLPAIENLNDISAELINVSGFRAEIANVANDILNVNTVANAINNNTGIGGSGSGGGQFLGTSIIKGVQYMSSVSAPNETITITSGLNAFSVDSFTLADGASIVVEDNAVYKVL